MLRVSLAASGPVGWYRSGFEGVEAVEGVEGFEGFGSQEKDEAVGRA